MHERDKRTMFVSTKDSGRSSVTPVSKAKQTGGISFPRDVHCRAESSLKANAKVR